MKLRHLCGGGLVLLTLGLVTLSLRVRDTSDASLRPYVVARPDYPVVFTSRTTTASLQASAAVGTGFTMPGQPQWQADEGRLRLLTPQGTVRELTWGRTLPDGDSICDVMSPSLAPDAKTIVFAGRLASGRDGGRFRIYAVDLHGRNLRRLTGGADDEGCVTLPPLRLDRDGERLPDDVRRRTDYDDVDPMLCPDGTLVFASSRLPDLGSTHGRRATQIWIKRPDAKPTPLTGSRANDRWPYLLTNGYLTFSVWSHQDEVISNDGRTLVRNSEGVSGLTQPANHWFAAIQRLTGERFGMMAKIPEPVWRPRPLANGRVAFMSASIAAEDAKSPMRVAQCEPGLIANSPTSLASGETLPSSDQPRVWWLPSTDSQGKGWSYATPAACPPSDVLIAAAPVAADDTVAPQAYGIYRVTQEDWPSRDQATAGPVPHLLFDDPRFVDAEPIAVYQRSVEPLGFKPPDASFSTDQTVALSNGQQYHGPAGEIHAMGIYFHELANLPGQKNSLGEGPTFAPFPPGSIQSLAIYASPRDRFDDPEQPWIPGQLEHLLNVPVDQASAGSAKAVLPAGLPTILLGLDADGKVVTGSSDATNAQGQRPRFYALAGDHVSTVRAGGYHFCTGCHAGHTHPFANDFAERVGR